MISRTDAVPVAQRLDGPLALNDTLECGTDDAIVLLSMGRVLGVLGPGTHVLAPQQIPFLASAGGADGKLEVEVWFVRTAIRAGVNGGGQLGAFLDPATSRSVKANGFGTMSYRITDPARFVTNVAGMADVDDGLRQTVQARVMDAVQRLAADLVQRQGTTAALTDPRRTAEFAEAIPGSVNPALQDFGVELSGVERWQCNLSDEGAAAPPPPAERTYEMLWDCPHCGAKKNLGLTHRHCPNCGGPQDASWRYFPSDDEKVAVEDHEYVGADLRCGYCSQFTSRRAQHCGGCGAPLEGAEQTRQRQDQLAAGPYAGESMQDARREFAPAPAPTAQAKPRRRWLLWLGGAGCLTVLFIAVALALVFFLWKREGELKVAGHSWNREIQVERYGPVHESDWCDQMPTGATEVTRTREVRSHRKVPDGQDCKTRRVDRGDGTYVEKQECTTKYRKEPVHDDKCRYKIVKWSRARTERASGTSVAEEPRWPEVKLGRTGQCVGCERAGTRSETYVVQFVEPGSGETAQCEFDQKKWQTFKPDSRWTGKLSVIGSVLDCSSLKPR